MPKQRRRYNESHSDHRNDSIHNSRDAIRANDGTGNALFRILRGPKTMIPEPYGRHLPIFPHIYDPIQERALERIIERMMDRADAALLDNKATQDQYNLWVAALNSWANRAPLAR